MIKNKKNKGILSFRTKAEVIVIAGFLIALSALSAVSVTRTITDTSDDIETFIRNSNGKYWAATDANIQLALDDIGTDNKGEVILPGNTAIEISTTITIPRNVTLDLQSCVLKATADINVIRMMPSSTIKNGQIDITYASFSKAAIYLNGDDGFIFYNDWYGSSRMHTNILNMNIISASQNGYGLHFYIPNSEGSHSVGWVNVEDYSSCYTNKSIFLDNKYSGSGDGGWINGNTFSNLQGMDDGWFIYLDGQMQDGTGEVKTATSGNIFNNVMFQPNDHAIGVLYIEGWGNVFTNVMIWDWDGGKDPSSNCSVFFTSVARKNYVQGSYGLNGYDIINNAGDYAYTNTVFATGSNWKTGAAGANLSIRRVDTDYLEIDDSYGINYGGSQDLQIFKSASADRHMYLWGAGGVYADLVWNANGFNIASSAENIYIAPGSGIVEITGQLEIDGIEFDSDYMELDTLIRNSKGNYWTATWANWQNAVDDLGTGGGDIWIPVGNYTATSTLVIDENSDAITIHGSGRGYWQLERPNYNQSTVIWIGADLPDGVIQVKGVTIGWNFNNRVVIKDLSIVGNKNDRDKYVATGINISFCDAPLIENIQFESINGEAIHVDTCYAPIIEKCLFNDCGNGTTYKPAINFTSSWGGAGNLVTTPTVDKCVFEPCEYSFIDCAKDEKTVTNGLVTGCYFESSYDDTASKPIYGVQPGSYWQISNNKFLGAFNHSAIYVSSAHQINLIISDNQFSSGANLTNEKYAQICFDIGGGHSTISGNVFREVTNHGIYLGSSTFNVTVGNNDFYNVDNICIYTWARDCVISDNIFGSGGSRLLHMRSAVENTSITGNKFDCDTTHNSIVHGGDYNLISDNIFRHDSTPFDGTAGANTVIKDNIGYTTESSGECHIDVGSDSVVVNHNMSLAPTCPIQITPACNLTASAITCYWTDTYTATQFTLHVNKDAVATIYFGWDSKAT